MVAIGIVAFGLLFMYAGKVESLVIDKQAGVMTKAKTNIFCRKAQQEWAIDQIRNLRVFKRGNDGI